MEGIVGSLMGFVLYFRCTFSEGGMMVEAHSGENIFFSYYLTQGDHPFFV